MADPRGFEPQSPESKSGILPLDEGSTKLDGTVGFEPTTAFSADYLLPTTFTPRVTLYQTELCPDKNFELLTPVTA